METYDLSRFIIPASEPKSKVVLPEFMDGNFLEVAAIKENLLNHLDHPDVSQHTENQGWGNEFAKDNSTKRKGRDKKQEEEIKAYLIFSLYIFVPALCLSFPRVFGNSLLLWSLYVSLFSRGFVDFRS
ncbi:hypothetical protein LOK49_LG07G00943 [Camellia lanceoleosa]|uniref:Uncharacterized protein n=1 Tax=Camellia lanceoleosa TaxID=1840588 RepID=A0ACC0H4G8_9ERIC|nr:hypothetical protein LOK49_LG07G00943 [Camellia lanceoleosa]